MARVAYRTALELEATKRIRLRDEERARERARLESTQRDVVEPITLIEGRRILPHTAVLQRPARYKAFSGGRGRGASHFFAEQAVEEMVRNPSLRFACIREVQKALKFSAKSLVESKIRSLNVAHLFETTESEIRRRGHDGVMIFQGMQDHTSDSIKSLEGFGRAWVEEAHAISQKSLDILLPTMRAPQSEIWFSWNPDVATDAVELFFQELKRQAAAGDIPRDRFVHVFASYLENSFATPEIIDEAERIRKSDIDAYEHIWLGGYFLGGKGRVYSSFINREYPLGNLDESIRDNGGELLVGMDFNVNPMSCVIAQRAGDECLILAALEIPTSNTAEMAQELKRRYPKRRIIVCPDPAGKQRRSSAPVGQTDFTILQAAGFIVRAPQGPPLVVDRINNSQSMFYDVETKRRRMRIHPIDAKPFVTALANLTYKENKQDMGDKRQNKSSGFDHICDAAGYLCWQEFNVLYRGPSVRFGSVSA